MYEINSTFLRHLTAYLVIVSLCLPSLAQAIGDDERAGSQTNYVRMPQGETQPEEQEPVAGFPVVQAVPGIGDVNSDGVMGQLERVQTSLTAQPTRQSLSIADFEDEGFFTRQTMRMCAGRCLNLLRRKEVWAMILGWGSATLLISGLIYFDVRPHHNSTHTP